jgi:two-component system, cell cycle response regulator CtrA
MRVLSVEGNIRHANALSAYLKSEGLVVEPVDTGADALDLLRHYEFDLVLLSLSLPDMDGSTLITRIRAAGQHTPILALTDVSDARSRLKALAAGGDDVVERNIDRAELLARMRAIFRRSRCYSRATIQIGALTLNIDQQEATANGCRIALTAKEFAILQVLMLRKNMILTKEMILSQLYGGMDEPEIKIIDVFICKIRSKLAKAGLRDVIGTVWGRGYTVRDQRRDDEPSPLVTSPAEPGRLAPVLA